MPQERSGGEAAFETVGAATRAVSKVAPAGTSVERQQLKAKAQRWKEKAAAEAPRGGGAEEEAREQALEAQWEPQREADGRPPSLREIAPPLQELRGGGEQQC